MKAWTVTILTVALMAAAISMSTAAPATGTTKNTGSNMNNQTTNVNRSKHHGTTTSAQVDYLNIPFKTITGNDSTLAAFKGKVVLVVNTASKCGYTPQYSGLEKLYEKYKDRGLVVIGFPANNFGGQEPGTNEQIASFCSTTYGVTFPMMAKISVLGTDEHPLFVQLTEHAGINGPIQWNFSKFLLNRNGKLVARYASKTEPNDPHLTSKIESLL